MRHITEFFGTNERLSTSLINHNQNYGDARNDSNNYQINDFDYQTRWMLR